MTLTFTKIKELLLSIEKDYGIYIREISLMKKDLYNLIKRQEHIKLESFNKFTDKNIIFYPYPETNHKVKLTVKKLIKMSKSNKKFIKKHF